MPFCKKELRHLAGAFALARTSICGNRNIKIGATVVDKRGIQYSGVNSNKSHPMQQRFNKRRFGAEIHDTVGHTLHAEMAAIKNAINRRVDLTGAAIYIARIGGKNTKYGMCRPCKACMEAIISVGITDIFYTTEQGIAHERVM
jgi:deoxycytidylate deaminase